MLCSENNNSLFKYIYAYKHDTWYIFEKVDREGYPYKRSPNWNIKKLKKKTRVKIISAGTKWYSKKDI